MADSRSARSDLLRPIPLPVEPGARLRAGLPVPVSSFVGRDRELATLADLIRQDAVRWVTVTGPGGVGKSRLAIRAAAMVAGGPIGCCFLDCSAIAEPDQLLPALGRAVGVRERAGRQLPERLAETLADQELVLLIDNVEHLADCVPALIALLSATPRVKMLVTSRVRLRASGEHVVTVPPLPLPDDDADPLNVSRSEAVRLFVERARAVSPDFALTAETAPVVAGICRRLDGLPLAIELAAAWTAHLPPARLIERLDARLPLLTDGPRDAPARQRTMRDAIAWSYGLLAPEEQALFRRLAVFVNGFDLDAAASVANDAADALRRTAALVDASLLQRSSGVAQSPRFSLLETVREFGLEQLRAAGEEAAVRARHAGWCLALAEQGFTALVRARSVDPAWLDRFELEHANMRSALGWLAETGGHERVIQLAGAMGPFWFFRGHLFEGRRWLERALDRAAEAAPSDRARARMSLGVLLQVLGETDRAVALLDEAIRAWRAAGEQMLAAQASIALGWIAVKAGRYDDAASAIDESVGLFPPDADWWIAKADYHRGEAALGRGGLTHAGELFDRALHRYEEIADAWGVGSSLLGLGAVASDRGRSRDAARHYRAALPAWQAVGTPEGLVVWLAGVAKLLGGLGRADAARLFGAVPALAGELGVALGLPERDRFGRAEARLRAALGEAAFDDGVGAGRCLTIEQAITESLTQLNEPAANGESYDGSDPTGLTRRERDVLRLITTGATDREIAETLSISPRTVGTHVTHILAKLGVESRRTARVRALQEHLV